MGAIRFTVQASSGLADEAAGRAYLLGQDLIPWPTTVEWRAPTLTLHRQARDSGYARIPWTLPGRGELVLTTATLVEREAPYLLEVELARGKVHQLRNSLCDWLSQGLVVPPEVHVALRRAQGLFAQATTRQHEPAAASALAVQALSAACDLGERLARLYAEQAIASRRRQSSRLDLLLAGNLGPAHMDRPTSKPFRRVFNAAALPLAWPQLEAKEGAYDWSVADHQFDWCDAHQLKIIAGPLVQLDRAGLPDWLYLWDGDYASLAGFILAHVRAVVQRFRGRPSLWHAVARANTGGALSLDEEQTLHLTVQVIEAIRQLDPDTPIVMSFAQPWADYMARQETELAPWHFADALVRAGLGLAGIMLEIPWGCGPNGVAPRDALDVIRQLDLWSLIGLPLLVDLTIPSSAAADALSGAGTWVGPAPESAGWSLDAQRRMWDQWLGLLLARPNVRVAIAHQVRDGAPHEFPQGGLLDGRGEPKPALEALAVLRREFLH